MSLPPMTADEFRDWLLCLRLRDAKVEGEYFQHFQQDPRVRYVARTRQFLKSFQSRWDSSDVKNSAAAKFVHDLQHGRYPELDTLESFNKLMRQYVMTKKNEKIRHDQADMRSVHQELPQAEEAHDHLDKTPAPEQQATGNSLLDEFQRFLSVLATRARVQGEERNGTTEIEAIWKLKLEGASLTEIATRVVLTENQVKRALQSSREKFQEYLNRKGHPESPGP